MKTVPLFVVLIALLPFSVVSQDTLSFYNNNSVFGEIKSMQKGVITIETPYSKNDFTIEWNKLKEIRTTSTFLMTLKNGDRFSGVIKSIDSVHVILIGAIDGRSQHLLGDIVSMKPVSKGIKDRIKANISLGYSITKAQNAQQFSVRSAVSYSARRWASDLSYNSVFSKQDDIPDIDRKDGGINYNYFLPKDWYVPLSISFLSNTEQLLKLRLLGKGGIGKYFLHTNKLYWGLSVGANYNTETYLDDTPHRRSWESFMGTELNLFDIGDLSLMTRVVGYPSLTESGRFRADFSLDTKYDLPLDFFVSIGVTVNYDNRPVEGASDTDYVCQTTFGWKWD
ncbi:DUF481 domain-containing protein [Chryseolinea sp. T2]|uniref:DUF481 domain-containing protein n=1 Tax=Chryseolinea sp. T2 TaxID=3129255 RepID=UPI0030785650